MLEGIEVLILAGGKGTRLAGVIGNKPKPMALINDRPFLEYLIDSIKVQGFRRFQLLVGFQADEIKNHFGDGSRFGVDITYSTEDKPLGTGGALKKAIFESKFGQFLIFNGDTLFEADLKLLLESAKNNLAISLRYVENSSRYGEVKIGSDYLIHSFLEKNPNAIDGYINAGIYFFDRSVLKYLPDQESFSLETELMPRLASEKKLVGLPMGGKFIDIGIPEDLEKAQSYVKKFNFTQRQGALFLDRDGIIIEDSGYLSDPKDIKIYPEIIPLIQLANKSNMLVIVVTNQAGIGRGYFSEVECDLVNASLIETLKANQAKIDKVFICPFHPTKGVGLYLKDSLLRKPHPGMLLIAQNEFAIDLHRSLMIGDKVSDIIQLPGLETVLIQRNYDLSDAKGEVKIFNLLSEVIPIVKAKVGS